VPGTDREMGMGIAEFPPNSESKDFLPHAPQTVTGKALQARSRTSTILQTTALE
jgi:hypothetical protein